MELTTVQKPRVTSLKFINNLEALRGCAALIVVWYHTTNHPFNVDPGFQPYGFATFTPPGHIAVLIFFVLSGYVIEISTPVLSTSSQIITYLKKRFVRIYPIYFAALLIALMVAEHNYSAKTLLANFTLTQIALSPLISENDPTWSLHYEVLFYLLFIPMRYFNVSPLLVAVGAFMIALINLAIGISVPVVSSYMLGFVFWLTGIIVARYSRNQEMLGIRYARLPSSLFLFLTLLYYNSFLIKTILIVIAMLNLDLSYPVGTSWEKQIMTFEDFAYMPYCLFVLMLFIGKDYKFRKIIELILMLLPLHALWEFFIFKYNSANRSEWILPTGFYIVSLFIYVFPQFFEKLSKKIISAFMMFGNISYGIYIIHFPVLVFFKHWTLFSGSLATWLIRAICYIVITIMLAYLVERIYQPKVRQAVGW